MRPWGGKHQQGIPGRNAPQQLRGSYELAKCIVTGIRQNKLPIATFLVEDVPPFDPSHPDPVASFHMPASGQTTTTAPLGN